MRTHGLALVAACSLSLLMAGCTAARGDTAATTATVLPAPASIAAPIAPAMMPAGNPVQIAVHGVVLSAPGRPFRGATISVRRLPASRDCSSCGTIRARSDARGEFTLILARGSYLLTCNAQDGRVCRLEDATGPGLLTATSKPLRPVLIMSRAGTPHPR